MASRQDVDLHLVLKDPKCARAYIEGFDWSPTPPPKFIFIDLDIRIDLTNGAKYLSDREAVDAALCILRDVDIPRSVRERNLQTWIQ